MPIKGHLIDPIGCQATSRALRDMEYENCQTKLCCHRLKYLHETYE